MLKIKQQSEPKPRGLQIAEALGDVNGGKLVDALQFDDQLVFYNQVRNVLADQVTFVMDRVCDLIADLDATRGQFSRQRPLIKLLKKPAPSVLETSYAAPITISVRSTPA